MNFYDVLMMKGFRNSDDFFNILDFCNRRTFNAICSQDLERWRYYYIDHLIRYASHNWFLSLDVDNLDLGASK